MKYHTLFVIFEKASKFEIVVCCKKIGGALRVKSGLSIVYIVGSQSIIFKQNVFLSLNNNLFLANSVDPDKKSHFVAFHLDLHCF